MPCEVCKGQRYNREALEILYKGKTIAEVLDMTVTEACEYFDKVPRISAKLETLRGVGLGYIRLGQPATTLSGGEAQRVKLSTELSKRSTGRTLYILDEPTTGLSFEDTRALLEVLQRLVDGGNSVVVIEHHMDVIKNADHIVDLGPMGGDRGGRIIAQGTPEEVAVVEESFTGQYLINVLPAERIEAARAAKKRNGASKRATKTKVGGLKVGRPASNGKEKPAAKRTTPVTATKNGRTKAKTGTRGR